jgi:hypothetical protein
LKLRLKLRWPANVLKDARETAGATLLPGACVRVTGIGRGAYRPYTADAGAE